MNSTGVCYFELQGGVISKLSRKAVPQLHIESKTGIMLRPKAVRDVIFCERKEWIGIEERSSA